jgi:hypothetical protein
LLRPHDRGAGDDLFVGRHDEHDGDDRHVELTDSDDLGVGDVDAFRRGSSCRKASTWPSPRAGAGRSSRWIPGESDASSSSATT